MSKYDYNLVVIGAGSAGLVTSYIAAAAKAKVALIERHKMGGDCLNTGCVPSKALIRTASVFRDAQRAQELGLKSVEVKYDFAEVMERVSQVISKIEPHDSVERYSSLGVDCYAGEAKIISANEVEVDGRKLTTRSIVICAGAAPFVPPITGLKESDYRTSDTVWDIRKQPKRLVVLGGGPIGSELAQAFCYLGSDVSQVEGGSRIMPREDEDASAVVMEHFREAGVNLLLETRAIEVIDKNGGRALVCTKKAEDGQDERIELEFDLLLIATGRKPNGDKVPGLKEIGVEVSDRGVVVVNEYLQSVTVPNVFACGDIIGSYQFTHTAAHGAYYCAMNAMLPIKQKVDWSIVPWCTFTHPEVARVGVSEAEAKAKHLNYEVSKYGIDDLDRAIADSEDHGFVKVLTASGTDKIIGVTIVGHHAGDLIHEYVLAMKAKLGLNSILRTMHIYPTLAESNKFAASEWKKAHIPPILIKISEKIATWRRS